MKGRAWAWIRNLIRVRVLPFARLGVYCLTVGLVLSLPALHASYAQAQEATFRFGRGLSELGELTGAPQGVVINGIRFFLSVQKVDVPLREALDRLDQHCQEHAGGFEGDFARIPKAKLEALPDEMKDPKRLSILRSETEREGVVLCLAAAGGGGVSGLVERISNFEKSGDLTAIGELRFVYAREIGPRSSTVVTAWHEGPFQVDQALFFEGDAPGRDTMRLPRPPGAKRMLSADVLDRPFALRTYLLSGEPEKALEQWDRVAKSNGWTRLPDPDGMGQHDRSFLLGDSIVFMMAQKSEEPGRSYVSLIEMGTKGSIESRAAAQVRLGAK